MVDWGVRERARPSRHGNGPTFDLVQSKLRSPPVRSGTVRRSSLIDRLRRDDAHPIVSVVAPAGYGKTTLLAQWAGGTGQEFAWVSVDEQDNDPKVLLTYIAAALDAIEPVGERVFDALASPASSVPGSVVPRLGSAFASLSTPVVLVIDDVHLVRNSEGRAALSVLADHVPRGSRLVLAGRDQAPLRVARLRAEGRILEVGPGDLALTVPEAASLLAAVEVALGDDELAQLHQRTEGWAAGLYLAALAIRGGGSAGTAVSIGGADVFVAEYVESEFLARISGRQREFLTRTAVLERMCGPLCEAVLELPGSATMLTDLAQSNMLLVPLDHRGQWYRYHHLLRDMLLAELKRVEPGLIPVLQRRAADWCLQNGLPEDALEYSMAAGDVETAACLAERLWHQAYGQGLTTTRQRWIGWLDERDGMRGHPLLAVQAAFIAAHTGQAAEAERWAEAVDSWQYEDLARPDNPAAEAWAAALRAHLCRRGVEQMRADADEFARRIAAQPITVQAAFAALKAPLLQGVARILCGDPDGGEAFLEVALGTQDADAPELRARALCQRSLLAMTRHEWGQAEALAGQARSVWREARVEDSYVTPLVCAVQGRVAAHRGDATAAREQLVSAQRLRHLLTYAVPAIAVQARIELTRVHLALADLAGARTLMRETGELLTRRPGLGTLAEEAEALRVQLSRQRGTATPGPSALTGAELRLLPLLSTHLTAAEIAAELVLSPHTIKSQMQSTYRKLAASSRNQAITRARELGLLEE
jgi:LuxR family transcriptional regulator, maltose regulon positive regulatory protein